MVYTIGDVSKLVTNILTRITISNAFKENAFLYEEYYVKDYETPESLAFEYYGSTDYYWVLLLCNEIIYPWNDWAVSQKTVENNTKEKYGAENIYHTHHHIDENGMIVNEREDYFPVSNITYETEENNKKRSVKILNKALLQPSLTEFNALLKLT